MRLSLDTRVIRSRGKGVSENAWDNEGVNASEHVQSIVRDRRLANVFSSDHVCEISVRSPLKPAKKSAAANPRSGAPAQGQQRIMGGTQLWWPLHKR